MISKVCCGRAAATGAATATPTAAMKSRRVTCDSPFLLARSCRVGGRRAAATTTAPTNDWAARSSVLRYRTGRVSQEGSVAGVAELLQQSNPRRVIAIRGQIL